MDQQLGSLWTDFHEISYLNISRKSVEKIKVSLKSDKNNRYITSTPIYIFNNISLISSQNEQCFGKKLYRKSTHILCSVNFFFRKSCRLWGKVEKYCRAGQTTDDNIIRLMRTACCIPMAINMHSEYVISFHCNTGCTNAPGCSVIRTLSWCNWDCSPRGTNKAL